MDPVTVLFEQPLVVLGAAVDVEWMAEMQAAAAAAKAKKPAAKKPAAKK